MAPGIFSCCFAPKEREPTEEEKYLDAIISEIVVSEHNYYNKLNAYVNFYGKAVVEIAAGKHGRKKQKELKLTRREAELLGGRNIQRVCACSESLLREIKVLVDKTHPNFPKTAYHRTQELIDIFDRRCGDLKKAYFPYVQAYKKCNGIVQRGKAEAAAVDRIPPQPTKRKLKRGRSLLRFKSIQVTEEVAPIVQGLSQNHYVSLWDFSTEQQFYLMESGMDSILIMPVQRLYQTKLRLERLVKYLEEETAEYTSVVHLVSKINKLATELNRSL
mmetsp:Transcript_15937/g.17998  ORF Transcript_15937/g.17998 Transcript_15937/m.17998 type:complete len:274 (+) Transcript_15937:266-1087(+)